MIINHHYHHHHQHQHQQQQQKQQLDDFINFRLGGFCAGRIATATLKLVGNNATGTETSPGASLIAGMACT
eukprot:1893694-Pleurochrysis_carterae.AAC.2